MMSRYIEFVTGQNGSEEVIKWVDANLVNYLSKHPDKEDQTEIEHILDFLMSNKAPKRLKKMSYKEAKAGAEKWVKALVKKGNNIIETEEDVEVIKVYKNGLRLVKLVGESAFKREGNLMRHCAASYFGKDNGCTVYSIRDEFNKPHCTIEVTSNDYGNQIKGKGNGSIHPKYIKTVLKALKRITNNKIRISELANLGYIDLEDVSKGFTKWMKEHKPDSKWLTFSGKELYYNG